MTVHQSIKGAPMACRNGRALTMDAAKRGPMRPGKPSLYGRQLRGQDAISLEGGAAGGAAAALLERELSSTRAELAAARTEVCAADVFVCLFVCLLAFLFFVFVFLLVWFVG